MCVWSNLCGYVLYTFNNMTPTAAIWHILSVKVRSVTWYRVSRLRHNPNFTNDYLTVRQLLESHFYISEYLSGSIYFLSQLTESYGYLFLIKPPLSSTSTSNNSTFVPINFSSVLFTTQKNGFTVESN